MKNNNKITHFKVLSLFFLLCLFLSLGLLISCGTSKELGVKSDSNSLNINNKDIGKTKSNISTLKTTNNAEEVSYVKIGSSSIDISNIPVERNIRSNRFSGIESSEIIKTSAQEKLKASVGVELIQGVEQYVFVSKTRKTIGITTHYITIGDSSDYYDKTILEIYDRTGQLKWITEEKGRMPSPLLIPDDSTSNYIINWAKHDEGLNALKAFVYDNSGNKVDSIFNINQVIYSKENQHLYYTKDYLYSEDLTDKSTVYYYNIQNRKSWNLHLSANAYLQLHNITNNGEYLLCFGDKEIYVFNRAGKLVWKNHRSEFQNGTIILSGSARYILKISASDDSYLVYSVENNKVISENKIKSGRNTNYFCHHGDFINDSIFAISSINADEQLILDFYDVYNGCFYSYTTSESQCNPFYITELNDKFLIYFNWVQSELLYRSDIQEIYDDFKVKNLKK